MGVNATPGYLCWASMIQRCTNPNHDSYRYYGGRGITVCDEWRQFKNFIRDVGNRPSDGHTIERLDPNLGYEPGNVVWADITTQAINRRLSTRNTTGYRGVSPIPAKVPRWRVQVCIKGRVFNVGVFTDMDEAAWMYDQWALAIHGDVAQLNFSYKQKGSE